VSTAVTTVIVRKAPTELTVHSTHENTNEIMLMLEKMMEKLCEWTERIEAQTSTTTERDITIWKRLLANCEEALKWKVTALIEVEKGQAELRKSLEAKDAELTKVRTDLDAERRSRTNVEQLRRELREAQVYGKSLKRRVGILRGDVDEAR
jgi:hypothetical protein